MRRNKKDVSLDAHSELRGWTEKHSSPIDSCSPLLFLLRLLRTLCLYHHLPSIFSLLIDIRSDHLDCSIYLLLMCSSNSPGHHLVNQLMPRVVLYSCVT